MTERLRPWTKVTEFRRGLARALCSDVFKGPHSSLTLPLSHHPVTWFPQCLPPPSQGAAWDRGSLWGAVHLVMPAGGWGWHFFLSAVKLGTSGVGKQLAPRPPRTCSSSLTPTPLHSPKPFPLCNAREHLVLAAVVFSDTCWYHIKLKVVFCLHNTLQSPTASIWFIT